jgi:hypothetical protein
MWSQPPAQWVVHRGIERVGHERPNIFCGLPGSMSFGKIVDQ